MRHYRKGTGPRLMLVTMLLTAGAPGMSVAQPGAGAPAAAQSTVSNARIRTWTDPNIATLMLVESLGYAGARAVVVRRPGEIPNNIILVTRATTPADLANAASALIISRRNRGERVDREIRALIGAPPVSTVPAPATRGGAAAVKRGVAGTSSGAKRPPGAPPSRSERRAAADLARLRAAPEFTIPGLGRGPALVIRMKDRPRSKTD